MTETLATPQPEARKSRTFGELLTTDLRALPVVIGLAALWFFLRLKVTSS
jgi:D-xylose transport system permease protein